MSSAGASWLGHPLADSLLRFELLPSLALHPAQAARLLPAPLQQLLEAGQLALPALHRHWSALLRRELQLAPLADLQDPALPLALAPPPLFERLLQHAGLALLGPRVRRAITRAEVAAWRDKLGEEGLRYARHAPPLTEAAADGAPDQLGAALLHTVFEAATPPVAARALLRLPPEAGAARTLLPAACAAPAAALALAQSVLASLEPAWLSSFPATR